MFSLFFQVKNLPLVVIFSISLFGGCTAEAAKEQKDGEQSINQLQEPTTSSTAKNESAKPTIKIEPNSPADSVRSFYGHLRERKFREAMFLTNLRPAIEGLTDAEMKEVDGFIRKNTTGKFGSVRSVKPVLVFELAFEGIQPSPRHKSGVATRFPRILNWRRDKAAEEADTLDALLAMAELNRAMPG